MKQYLYTLVMKEKPGFIGQCLRFLLFLLSLLYGLIVRSMAFLGQRRTHEAGCTVISVGNITVGGTGKTLLVEYIARFLQERGKRPAILSRGYARPGSGVPGSYGARGDEPQMLGEKLKGIAVVVDPDRAAAAKKAVAVHRADTVILDDGFQQWHIRKDLEIVCIDATAPFGNGYLLPRGTLREPLSALSRADVFVLTKTDFGHDIARTVERLKRYNAGAEFFETVHRLKGFSGLHDAADIAAAELKGQSVVALSGIADPDSFEARLVQAGIRIGLSLRFADHHPYSAGDAERICAAARSKGIATVVTTEKDAVRLGGLAFAAGQVRVLVMHIEIAFVKNEEGFHTRLLGLYPR